jgi:hypothetical protein
MSIIKREKVPHVAPNRKENRDIDSERDGIPTRAMKKLHYINESSY